MYFKLALHNVRKSVRDYTIYFLTLTFGVCLFYVFNSMKSQQAMMDISKSQILILNTFSDFMGGVSIFVSVILGFLIIYANKFLIKRRKKELGLYLTLGMERGKVSKILILETLIIGVFSWTVGLVLGVFVSQGLAAVTADMLKASITKFRFIFSNEAAAKSAVYFGIIFIVVMIFNTITVSKYKLINLLYGGRKNESLKVKSLFVSVVLFLISVGCIGAAYYLLLDHGMMQIDAIFISCLILGAVGTFLFFLSLSGFLLRLIQSRKSMYYKNLNMFILRQINSKINTTFISMTLICLMLLVTIGTLSCGMGVAKVLTGGMEEATPYDATFSNNYDVTVEDIKAELNQAGLQLDDYVADDAVIHIYHIPGSDYKQILNYSKGSKAYKEFELVYDEMSSVDIDFIGVSEYNKILELQGKKPVTLNDDEFLINYNFEQVSDVYKAFEKQNGTITINNKTYKLNSRGITNYCLETTTMLGDYGTVVIPDSALANAKLDRTKLSVNYAGKDKVKTEEKLQKIIRKLNKEKGLNASVRFISRIEVFDQGAGIKTIITYFILYIGIIFLITSAAVLALQQLSESADNLERYQLLRKIGVEEKMMMHSIVVQIFIYFMMPLVLAMIHAYVGISEANRMISQLGHMNALSGIIFTAVMVILIYGGYFLATCLGSIQMVIRGK